MAKRSVPPTPGQTFGRWTVLAQAETVRRRQSTAPKWLCRCACGTERTVFQNSLLVGYSQSCGCRQKEVVTKHGLWTASGYHIWIGMNDRCHNMASGAYPNYGGRGITVCPEWRDTPEAFLNYIGTRPSPDHSLDRIDNDGPYAPGNVRWATRREQAQNRRSTHAITLNGDTRTITDWARRCGIDPSTLRTRLKRGWSIDQALTSPAGTSLLTRGRPKRAHSNAEIT